MSGGNQRSQAAKGADGCAAAAHGGTLCRIAAPPLVTEVGFVASGSGSED